MAKNTINRTQINSFIPEKVANKALNVLESYINLAKTVYRDFDQEIAENGDTVKVPKFGTLAANEMSQTGQVSLNYPADDEVSISLDQHWEVSFLIRDVARAMSKPAVLEGYVKNGMIALADKIETKLAALYASAGDSVSGGATWGLDDMRTLRQKFVDAKVPMLAPKFVYLNSDAYTDLLSETNVQDASALGQGATIVNGKLPNIYGMGIFESQNVQSAGSPTTYHGLGYVEEAMALVMRPLPLPPADFGVRSAVVTDPNSGLGLRVLYSWDSDHLGVQVTLDVLFGVGVLRSEHLFDLQNT